MMIRSFGLGLHWCGYAANEELFTALLLNGQRLSTLHIIESTR